MTAEIYVDGSYRPDGKKGGWANVILVNGRASMDMTAHIYRCRGNMSAEHEAILHALCMYPPQCNNVTIYTDQLGVVMFAQTNKANQAKALSKASKCMKNLLRAVMECEAHLVYCPSPSGKNKRKIKAKHLPHARKAHRLAGIASEG